MSELLSTDVLAVLNVGDYIFVGIGYSLRTYKKSNNSPIFKLDVCYPDKIHGIVKGPGNYLAVFGGKNVSIVELDIPDQTMRTTLFAEPHRFNDWIIAVGWWPTSKDDDSRLAILFAHNRLSLYNWRNKQTKEFQCEEKCILYGGSVVNDCLDNYVVFAGTVFQEIVVWAVTNVNNKNEVPVVHRLKGHNGVIFSVTFDPITRLICSTSDDRTIRLWSVEPDSIDSNIIKWETATISLMTTMFGHTARVWRALIRKNFVISIGEDSLVCVWTTKGTLIEKIEAHQGAAIWSIDVSEDGDVIITGGGDGAVHMWPLRKNTDTETKCIITQNSLDVPKHVGFLSSGMMVVITQTGKMLIHNNEVDLIKESIDIKMYSSYVVMQISPNRRRLSLASLDGHVTLYDEEKDAGCLHKVLEEKIVDSKILSMHWLNNDSLLLCGNGGILKTLKIVNDLAIVASEHVLPQSRERWTTAAIIHKSLLICGDRAGSIHLFKTSDIENFGKKESAADSACASPFQSLLKIHGRLGVHSCNILENKLLTTGRDGTLRFYELRKINNRQTISALHIEQMPMDWVSKTLKTNTDLYVLGFKEVDFILYSTTHQRALWRIRCGGGHRSWDYTLKDGIFSFAYIRDKQIHSAKCQLDSLAIPAIENGFHAKEVYCIERIPTSTGYNILISGGEDRNLRITHITDSIPSKNKIQQFNTLALLSGHISSIKTLALINLEDTAVRSVSLIFSGGGRAQLKVWLISINFDQQSLDKNNLSCVELASHMLRGTDQQQRKTLQQGVQQSHFADPETRYMNISARRIQANSNLVLLLVACSDGFLRIFSYNVTTCSIVSRTAIAYYNRCIIKTHLFNHDENVIGLTMATDGIVNFWCLNDTVEMIVRDLSENNELEFTTNLSPFARLRLHQCGINSYDLKKLKGSQLVLATGGDDNLLCLLVFEIKSKNGALCINEIRKWDCSSAHSTQITGLILDERGSLISVGIDQKVLTFDYLYEHENLTVSLANEIITSVPDVQGMIRCYTKEINDALLCVYGKGFELIRRELKSIPVK